MRNRLDHRLSRLSQRTNTNGTAGSYTYKRRITAFSLNVTAVWRFQSPLHETRCPASRTAECRARIHSQPKLHVRLIRTSRCTIQTMMQVYSIRVADVRVHAALADTTLADRTSADTTLVDATPTSVDERPTIRSRAIRSAAVPGVRIHHRVVRNFVHQLFGFRLAARASFVVAALAGCGVVESVRERREPTPHERYGQSLRDAGLSQSAMGREWLVAADTVMSNAHRVTLPLNETGYYDRGQARAVGWQFDVRDGQQITIALSVDGQPAQIFTDLFVATTDSVRRFEAVVSGATDSTQQSLLRYETRDSATLVLRVQPELLRGGRYHVTIRSDPVLAFPVEGRGNSAAQSFWGVDRDGGRRSHQGVDIFAPRGTPVLAATNGRITSVRPNNLGGNVIWQSDDRRAQTLYYAHLDRLYVDAGAYVNTGDTIGFVGNTGNARTTSPHLHFGIYRRGRGPIDPWPYVRRVTATFAPIRADTARIGRRVQLRAGSVALRVSPVAKGDTVAVATRLDTMHVMGAVGGFYRVELASGVAGYVPSSGVFRDLGDNVRGLIVGR